MAELVDGMHATGCLAYKGGDSTEIAPIASSSEDEGSIWAAKPTQSSVKENTQSQSIWECTVTAASFVQGGAESANPGMQSSSSNKGKERAEIEDTQDSDENIDQVSTDIYIYSMIPFMIRMGVKELDLDPDVRPENVKCQCSRSSASTGNSWCKV